MLFGWTSIGMKSVAADKKVIDHQLEDIRDNADSTETPHTHTRIKLWNREVARMAVAYTYSRLSNK